MKIATIILMFAMVFGLTPALAGAGVSSGNSQDAEKAAHRSEHASEVFREIMDAPDKGIPNSIIDKAEVIAVFPSVIKVGFIFGGRGGSGLVSVRDEQTHEWGAPIFVSLGGGSFGAQIGGQSIDLVLVGMTRHSADIFTKDRFKLGGELSATAGPVGRNAEASTDLPTLRSEVLSYSRSRGLFVGITVNGSVIKQDKDLNAAVYGVSKIENFRNVSLRNTNVAPRVMAFPHTLNKYTKNSGA